MALLTLNEIVGNGKAGAYVSAGSSGDAFPVSSDERTFLHVKNGGASAVTVSIVPAQPTEKEAGVGTFEVPTLTGSVAASGDMMFGPFPADYVGGNGQAAVSYSAVTSVTIAAYHLGKAD